MAELLNSKPNPNDGLYYKDGYINYESPLAMFTSVVLWRALYTLCRVSLNEKSPEYCSRIISFLHGVISAFFGINQCFLLDWPFDHPEWKTSYVQSFIMATSFGYFVHDLMWMMKYEREDTVMLCHHAVCIYSLAKMLFKGYSGAQATCALGSMELTNPFLQARWFLRSEGMQSSIVYISTETTFFLVFLTVRIIIGTYFLNIILKQPKNDWDFVIMSVVIYILSWLFIVGMVKYILRKYIGKKNVGNVASQKGGNKSD